MGNIQSNTKVNFEYMQNCIEYPNSQIVINVLDNDLQHCLIYTTVHAREEEEIVNKLRTSFILKSQSGTLGLLTCC